MLDDDSWNITSWHTQKNFRFPTIRRFLFLLVPLPIFSRFVVFIASPGNKIRWKKIIHGLWSPNIWMDLCYEIFWQPVAMWCLRMGSVCELLGQTVVMYCAQKIFWRWCEYKFKYYAYWSCEFGRPVSIIYFSAADWHISWPWFAVHFNWHRSNCSFSLIALNFVIESLIIIFLFFLLLKKNFLWVSCCHSKKLSAFKLPTLERAEINPTPKISRSIIGKIQKSTKNYLTAEYRLACTTGCFSCCD